MNVFDTYPPGLTVIWPVNRFWVAGSRTGAGLRKATGGGEDGLDTDVPPMRIIKNTIAMASKMPTVIPPRMREALTLDFGFGTDAAPVVD